MSTYSYNINDYAITINNNNNNNIYINIINNVNNYSYNGTFYKKDIPRIMEIANFYEFIKKCCDNETNYFLTIELTEITLILVFKNTQLLFTIDHQLILKKEILNDYEIITNQINELKLSNTKLQKENNELREKLDELKLKNIKLRKELDELTNEKIFINNRLIVNKNITELDLSSIHIDNHTVLLNILKLYKLKKLKINTNLFNNTYHNTLYNGIGLHIISNYFSRWNDNILEVITYTYNFNNYNNQNPSIQINKIPNPNNPDTQINFAQANYIEIIYK